VIRDWPSVCVCMTTCLCFLSLRPSLNRVCEKRATAPYTRSGSRRALRSASELAARLLPCALLGRLPSTLLCGLLLGTLSRCHTISSSCGVNHPTDPPVERRARFRSSRLEAGANGPDKARPWAGARNRSANHHRAGMSCHSAVQTSSLDDRCVRFVTPARRHVCSGRSPDASGVRDLRRADPGPDGRCVARLKIKRTGRHPVRGG
jgi:hypothetical protein